jgi:uncharacterized membrane protein
MGTRSQILAFNLGIESMPLVVVAGTISFLILLSRTSAYPMFRIGGAIFACFAALGWIAERWFDKHTLVDVVVDSMGHQAGWVALALYLTGLILWRRREQPKKSIARAEQMA